MQNRLLFLFIFLMAAAGGFAQDLIIKKNGDKIYCRIVQEDSMLIYFKKPAQKSTFEISKAEVEKYFYTKKAALTADGSRPRHELLVFNIAAGQASPRGDFESQDLYSDRSGLAKRGYVAKASLILKLSRNFGFSVAYRYQANPFNVELIRSQYAAIYPGVKFTAEKASWKVKGFFGGMYFTFPVKKIDGLAFDFDVSAGIPKCSFPQIEVTANQNGRYSKLTQTGNDASSTAILLGTGLKYSLGDHVGLSFNVNYMYAKAEFKNIFVGQFNGQSGYIDYTQKISTLNVQLGLSFFLFQKSS